MPDDKRPPVVALVLALPVRLVLYAVVNLLCAVRNLLRLLRRRPAWVRVRIDGQLPERPPRKRLWRRSRAPSLAALDDLGRALRRDPRVRGVLLEIDRIDAGWARLESLRRLIADWRAAGKPVLAHLSSPGNAEVFVAMACDEVLLDESGPVSLTGVAAEASFYGEALRRVGIDPELEREGVYKSAAETFTRGEMSAPTREALDAILDRLDARLVGAIAAGRNVTPERARELVAGGPYLCEAALQAGLVDAVLYRDRLPARLGVDEEAILSVSNYLAARPRWWNPGLLRRRRLVAVLSLEGLIASGQGSDVLVKSCGAETVGRALRALRKDSRVAAVVLSVDSRGGSAPASDRIWRAVERLAEKKPVVGYLGDVAASGGYYVALPCHHLVAQPETLSGSIGVVAGKVVVERLLDRLGVGTALLTRGPAAAMSSVRRRYDGVGRERLKAEVAGVYRQFVDRVVRGRRLDAERAEAAAKGRVWTGEDALARGLVDELGGLPTAIAGAKARAARPDEELVVRDVVLKPAFAGLLSLRGGPGALEGVVETLAGLAREPVHLVATDVPTIR